MLPLALTGVPEAVAGLAVLGAAAGLAGAGTAWLNVENGEKWYQGLGLQLFATVGELWARAGSAAEAEVGSQAAEALPDGPGAMKATPGFGSTKGPLGPKVRDLLAGYDVEVGSIQEADELLEQALPYAKKVRGAAPRRPLFVEFKGKNDFGMFHKDYLIDPSTGLVYGHDAAGPHAWAKHINVKLPFTGRKVTIIIKPK